METQASSKSGCRVGKKSDKSRRIWSMREEEALIEALKDIIVQGWKCPNGFRTGYLGILETAMLKKFPGSDIRALPHINSKIHVWKRTHGTLQTMISRSGFGWNDTTQMITVDDDEVWQKFVKTDANARTMRFKTFPFYPAWLEIFGKDRATGEHAEDLNDAGNDYLPVFEDDANENGSDNEFMSVCQEQASASGKQAPSKKRKVQESDHLKFGDAVQMFCSQTDSRLGEIAKRIGFEFDASEKRTKVYEALCKISGLGLTERTFVSMQLAKDKEILDLFFSIPDEAREEMVRLMITRQAP